MIKRTEKYCSENVAILHTPAWEIFLSANQAERYNLSVAETNVILYLFNAWEEEPISEVFIFLTTPNGLLEEWKNYLSPPLQDALEPLFTIEEWEESTKLKPSHFIAGSGEPGSPSEMDYENDEEALDHTPIRICINTPHLNKDIILHSVKEAINSLRPFGKEKFALMWEKETSEELAEKIVLYENMVNLAHDAEDREVFIKELINADMFWFRHVLPLKEKSEATRIITEPSYMHYVGVQDDEKKDQRLLEEKQAGNISLPSDNDNGEEEGDIVDWEMTYARLSSLKEWETKYPQFKISEALKWLDTKKKWR